MSLERHQRAVRASQNKSPSRDLEKVRRDKEWDHSKGAGSRKAGGEEGGKMTKSGFSLTISPMMTITPRKQHTHTHTRTRTHTHAHAHAHAHAHTHTRTHTLLLVKRCFRMVFLSPSFSPWRESKHSASLSLLTPSISHLQAKATLHRDFLEMNPHQFSWPILIVEFFPTHVMLIQFFLSKNYNRQKIQTKINFHQFS